MKTQSAGTHPVTFIDGKPVTIFGTQTGRWDSREPQRSNTPRDGRPRSNITLIDRVRKPYGKA